MLRRLIFALPALLACSTSGSSTWDGWPRPGPIVCDAGGSVCRSVCVDLQNDTANCGACGRLCAAGDRCSGGRCVCPGNAERCGTSTCVNLLTSRSHCGACGNACPSGQSCVQGACACSLTLLACGGRCVEPRSDVAHCGACGRACAASQRCVWGECVSRCPAGTGTCSGRAAVACDVTFANSPDHCGACGRRCGEGTTCAGGMCVCTGTCARPVRPTATVVSCAAGDASRCPSGRNATPVCGADGLCALQCAAGFDRCDPQDTSGCLTALTTADRCGSCDVACGRGEHCAWGVCACPPDQVRCGERCADLRADRAHCGACGSACEGDAECADGRCVPREAPRLLWPPSGAVIAGRRPTLRWLPRRGEAGGRAEVCRDRACASVREVLEQSSPSAQLSEEMPPGVYFWRVTGGGGTTVSPTWSFRITAARSGGGVLVGHTLDVNGDGFADHLRVDPSASSRVCLLAGSGGGLRAGVCRTAMAAGSPRMLAGQPAAGDFDGDGFTDAAALVNDGAEGRIVYFRGGVGGLSMAGSFGETNEGWQVGPSGRSLHGIGDVDGDGYADLAVSGTARGEAMFAVLGGGPGGPRWYPRAIVTAPHEVARVHGAQVMQAGDLDGDGGADLLTLSQNTSGVALVVRYDLGAPGASAVPAWSVTTVNPPAFLPGDTDGDRRMEVFVRGAANLRARRPGEPAPIALTLPTADRVAAVSTFDGARDLDGDGVFDLVTERASVSPRVLQQYSRASLASPRSAGVVEVATASPPFWLGDVNGDGRDDVGVPSTTEVLVYHGQEGGFPQFPSQRVPLRGPSD